MARPWVIKFKGAPEGARTEVLRKLLDVSPLLDRNPAAKDGLGGSVGFHCVNEFEYFDALRGQRPAHRPPP